MGRFLFGLIVAAGIGAGLAAQIRSPQDDRQRAIEDFARKKADEMAALNASRLGFLSQDGNLAIRRWDEAVRQWKQEKGAGAGPRLAEGVLFDCLSRFHGVLTAMVSSEPREGGLNYDPGTVQAERPARAAKAFEAALEADPTLAEARFRRARLRAAKDARARSELETLASGSPGVFSYLAAISRAETARELEDHDGARRWYTRAAELMPGAPAPQLGLASLAPPRPLPFETFLVSDPYYSYPCTVLTEPVGAELSTRVAAVIIK